MIDYFNTLIREHIIGAYWYDIFDVLRIFLTSMVPVLELRGAIAFGPLKHIPWPLTYIVAVAGNLVPVPFIILFIRSLLDFMKKKGLFASLAKKIEAKGEKNIDKINKYRSLGLYLFVAVPLPGTGAWTGSLVAALLKMPLKKAFPPIALGVATSGVIMTFFYYFLANAFPEIKYSYLVLGFVALIAVVFLIVFVIKKIKKHNSNKTEN